MSDLKIREGSPISATTWNHIVDRLPIDAVGAGGAATGVYGQSIVNAINKAGEDVDTGELVVIDALSGDSSGLAEGDVADAIEFEASRPVWHSAIAKVGVVVEPAKNDDPIKVCIDGLTLIKLNGNVGTNGWVQVSPTDPNVGIASTGGFAQTLSAYKDGWALAILNRTQWWWRYELNEDWQNPLTKAKLLALDGTTAVANEFDLSDPDGLMDDQVLGNKGWCVQAGNEFYAIQAKCN